MWWHQPVACVHVSSCDILVIMVSSHLLRSISQWTLTVKVETKCLANLNTCVLQGLVYCCEVWKQSIKYLLIFTFGWPDLSLSTVPPLPVQSIFRCDVCSLHILFDSVHPVLFFLIATDNGSGPIFMLVGLKQLHTPSLQGNNSSSIQFKNVLLNFVGKPELHYLLVCIVWGTLKSCLWGRNGSGTRVWSVRKHGLHTHLCTAVYKWGPFFIM